MTSISSPGGTRCEREPPLHVLACTGKEACIHVGQRHRGRLRGKHRARQTRRQRRERRVRESDQPRPEELGGTQVRVRPRQKPQQRLQILHLRRVEKSQPLIDVGADPASLERILEVLMTRARTKENGDVVAPNWPRAGVSVAHLAGFEQTHDFVGDCGGRLLGRRLRDQTEDRPTIPTRAGRDGRCGKPIGVAVLPAVGDLLVACHLRRQGVDEGQ
jgi:hypothetical protein